MWTLDVLVFDGVEHHSVEELREIVRVANEVAAHGRSAAGLFDVRLLSAMDDIAVRSERGNLVEADALLQTVPTGDVFGSRTVTRGP